MIQPSRRRCPKCNRKDSQLVRKHDQYAAASWRMTDMPVARVFTFRCKCDCRFDVTVAYDAKKASVSLPIFRIGKTISHALAFPNVAVAHAKKKGAV